MLVLTLTTGHKVTVNLDKVIRVVEYESHAEIYFDNGDTILVKEYEQTE